MLDAEDEMVAEEALAQLEALAPGTKLVFNIVTVNFLI